MTYLVDCDVQMLAFHGGLDGGPFDGGINGDDLPSDIINNGARTMIIGARTVVGLMWMGGRVATLSPGFSSPVLTTKYSVCSFWILYWAVIVE